MRPDRRQRGVALIEVLAAVTVLGMAGVALVRYVGESAATADRVRVREAEVDRAATVLTRLSLARATELQAREGLSRIDDLHVQVDRIEGRLFRVVIRSADGASEILRTHLAPSATEPSRAP